MMVSYIAALSVLPVNLAMFELFLTELNADAGEARRGVLGNPMRTSVIQLRPDGSSAGS